MENNYLVVNADGEVVVVVDTLIDAIDYVVSNNGIDGYIINADGEVLYICTSGEKDFSIENADGSIISEFRVNPRGADGKVK